MRFSQIATAALAAAVVRADAVEDVKEAASDASASVASAVSEATVSKPTFTPTTIKGAPFLEQFTDDWESRWKASHAKKQNDKKEDTEEWAFVGNWAVEEPHVLNGMVGDKGLVVKDKAAHHAISAIFKKPINPKKQPLVVQYEVKLQEGLECGGAYLKLLQENKKLHKEEFSNASPYIIMFGPDKCGATNKVHFIFRHKNPKTGEYEEKHLSNPPMARISKTSTLYQLAVFPNQTYSISLDGEVARTGSLFEDFTPSVNPEKEIDDPEDKKPETWVDEARIEDPEAKKPEDWDEDAPYEIVDTEATQPEDWLVNEPTTIPDPEAVKPEDWDDDEDGDWVAPTVPNPKCAEVSGCGKWEPAMKKNPDYKGKWTAPFIDNPAYKGVWAPRKIANPKFFEDKTPANFEPLGAIGFELWTMQNDILFDNIYVGHSLEEAEKLKAATYDLKIVAEKAEEEANAPKEEDPIKSPSDLVFKEDPVRYVKEKVDLFITIAKKDPLNAVKFVPEVAGGFAVVIVTVLALLLGALGGSSAPSKEQVKAAADKGKKAAIDAKDQAASAVSSATEKVQEETKKRQTRSGAQ
ncbi:calreticulin precursor [Venturia nashicola]|uniref:Calreticulin n=1 Tax=Venturia nashicola TaxID=86259 RepID=A0A4Z1NYR9_9PEZI|nr:calreticulin precursor [Venturia nashicola]TLD24475.1 calreticulin precursor [Venturia nashicola]